jgi:uncharacterized protein (TIGR03435 family)
MAMSNRILQAVIASLVLAGSAPLRPQTTRQESEPYEVVSVKPDDTSGPRYITMWPAGNLTGERMTLIELILAAYDVIWSPSNEKYIQGVPAWGSTRHFSIRAKPARSDESTDRRVLRELAKPRIRALLEDRFKLRIRREDKEMPAYALTVMKSGHKMKEEPVSEREGGMSAPGFYIGYRTSLAGLARTLSVRLDRPVVDRTGLIGYLHIELLYDPGVTGRAQPASKYDPKSETMVIAGPDEPERPSIFRAVQEQLGLKLEATTAAVPIWVIEHVELPSEN